MTVSTLYYRSIIVIIENEVSDPSLNLGRGCPYFTSH